ncbi:hypothetical protein CO657_13625 [Rhizobium acidisoli]|uniref:Uncharacterized protein n=1 Tax=Rhizobium acidisoli TaxID=1538158 RepID=A0AAE5TX50_9HYPH|nr:hypothetical protein [Rhizobium acidisoli]KPH08847.1 hypothetical protein AOG23_10025 [Rhizobium acidisoli]QAS79042.1 hypothetical protein CO657_13625 [Rhizobium acidisoli]
MSTATPDDRISTYNPVVATTQFAAGFPVFDNADIGVTVDGVERFDFTVTATYTAGISTDAKAVFSPGIVGDVVVFGKRAPRRSSRFINGSPLSIPDQNLALDTLEAEAQEAARENRRAHKAPYGEEGGVFTASDVGNAQANAASAAASAALAAKWAENGDLDVTPGKRASEYWARKAQEWAIGGVAGVGSFNSRTGPVTAQSGDYSSAQISRGGGSVETALAAIEADITATKGLLLSGIEDLLLSNNSGNPNTHIDIGTGKARVGSVVVANLATLTKRINATWVAGSGNGGLDTGAVAANGTYFLYALRKVSDGSFEAVFSTSATIAGVNVSLLAGYTIVKCIGVVLTNASSVIRPFIMYPRDEYAFVGPIAEVTNTTITTTSALLAITVPNGVRVKANLRFMFSSSATTASALFSDPAQGVLVAGGNNEGGNVGTIQVASGFACGSDEIWTNTSKQIRRVSGATGNMWVWNDGFHFPCGRNA